MPSRRDQLHSYQFMTQRVISAFVMRETDPAQSPLRRGIGAVFGGVMVAVLIAAGVGIYGLITKVGGDRWKTDGSVVIERETGATFVFLDGQLHPTVNYASALLAAGRPGQAAARVAAASLAGVPRGITVGIVGAPQSLPVAKQRIGLPWTVCAVPGTNDAGRPVSTVVVGVGVAPTGGRGTGEQGLLVRDAELGMNYLVWQGHRHLIQSSRVVIPALFGSVTATPVGTAWINALPAGADIAPVQVRDRGRASAALPGRTVGDILVAQTGAGPQYYLVLGDGLAPITALQRAILNAESAGEPAPIAVSEATSAPQSDQLRRPSGGVQPPPAPPQLSAPGADQLCAVTGEPDGVPALTTGGELPGVRASIPTVGAAPDGSRLADRILVPSGRVAVVRVLGSPASYQVITDLGIRYPVVSDAALQMLGYPAAEAVAVPAALVSRIPQGPTLDPQAAIRPALTGG
ncbi:type VII secretion protein EccB [Polymorphospora sp. NPDC051019]|uniref:type VII secretion protein EccB n=1 Tax=Polymorphospora sp. NPDC051019 TaxID=3155725 RepID=UPI00343AD3C1